MINSDFKIILFNGGFAGDLITALHNPNIFKHFNKESIIIDDKAKKLTSYQFRQQNTKEEKIKYLRSIENLGVCSSHDVELALHLKNNTTIVYCSDHRLNKIFFERAHRDKQDDMKMTLEQHLNWQDTNRSIFKNQVDIAKVTDIDFLDKLGITDLRSASLLKNWITLNNFVQ